MSRVLHRVAGRYAALLIVGSMVFLVGGLVLLKQQLAAGARLEAEARVTEVGVDEHGYWFVRIEVTNTGNTPWRAVMVSNPGLIANSPPALEVGSTLPCAPVPERFDFVIETMEEGDVPESPGAVTFDLAVISAEPWFLDTPEFGAWPYALKL